VKNVRLRKAAELLKEGGLSIAEIADQVGFNTPSYFTKSFKKLFGVLPTDKWIDVLNPSTEEVISKMPDGTPEDARAAINAAVKAQLSWESLTSIERAGYLTRIAQGIRKREQELTDIIIREGGKTRGLANVEVLFTADYLDYMAGWVLDCP